MNLNLKKTGEHTLSLETESGLRLDDIEIRIDGLAEGSENPSPLRRSEWQTVAAGVPEPATCFEQHLFSGDAPVAVATMVAQPGFAELQIKVLRPLRLAGRADTFEQSSVALPSFGFGRDARFLVTTHGLGPSGDGEIGGYWPRAIVGKGPTLLPTEAFAPMAIFDEGSALAVAPASQFLTSSLLRVNGRVERGLHGSVVDLEDGTTVRTLFAGGSDVGGALMALGDLLLDRGGRARPRPDEFKMTSTLGWWNAYGGYFTEPIHPLSGSTLRDVIRSLKEADVPIGYLGIDLWYPYATIGQALRFAPDLAKYPDGIGAIAREAGVATVPHLSALSPDNEYGSDGSDPSIYRDIAEELSRQEAAVAWHDWLRTQQHMTPVLRSNVVEAERWFEGLAEALSERDIQVLMCMQTMGMVLAATRCGNAIASRSTIDYLFAQEEALSTLDAIGQPGFRDNETPFHVMRRQNLLVGFVQYAMGLLPFHDLFLTQWHEKLGGAHPKQEAVLRALSCGPVGIGDAPGRTDASLAWSLLSSDGLLLQPDRPPFPIVKTLGEPIELYRTHRDAGQLTWTYLILLNTTDRPQDYDVDDLGDADVLVWDGLAGQIVESMSGTLPSGCLAYYVLVPYVDGVAPLGLRDKLVPAPAALIQRVRVEDGFTMDVNASGETFAFVAKGSIAVSDSRGDALPIRREGSFWICNLPEGAASLRVRGGELP